MSRRRHREHKTTMNLLLTCYLAQGSGIFEPGRRPDGASWYSFVEGPWAFVFGSVTAVTLVLFIWALFFRKRDPSEPLRRVIEASAAEDGGAFPKHRHHHRRHRRRRSDGSRRHRNPTLQETGGLPPRRSEEQSSAV